MKYLTVNICIYVAVYVHVQYIVVECGFILWPDPKFNTSQAADY